MASMNRVTLLGNLGKDPEVKAFEGGNKVASFSMATTEAYVDKTTNEKKETTDWHNVSIWGKLADVVENYCKKGSQVLIEGKLRTRSYDDKDGVKRYVTEVIGDKLLLLGKPTGAKEESAPQPQNASAVLDKKDEDLDMPF